MLYCVSRSGVPTHITSGAIARRPEAKNALRDDPWLMAASLETAAFPQSFQGVLCPIRRSY